MMVPQAIRMADSAFKKYKTRDPYEIIDARRIKLKDFYTLNSLLAFYTISNRKQVIGLNGHADPVQRRTGVVHELGHSLNDYKLAASGCEFGDYSFFSLSSAPLESMPISQVLNCALMMSLFSTVFIIMHTS